MQVSSCLNPKYVTNIYTGQLVRVDCGVCEACLMKRPLRYVKMLKYNRTLYQDCVFGTLTYSDDFVPKGVFCNHFVFSSVDKISDNSNFVYLPDYFNKENLKYVKSYEQSLGFLPIRSKSDAAAFVRTLRKRMSPNQFGLFLACEYGPTTFRPHFHLLFFFNPIGCERQVEVDSVPSILRSCWTTELRDSDSHKVKQPYVELGFTLFRYDANVSAQYTAQYLNCTTNLPTILKDKFPPFAQYSRSLSSVNVLSSSQVYELLFTGSAKVVISRNVSGRIFEELSFVPKDILLRYFPKFRGYNLLSVREYYNVILTISCISKEQFLEFAYSSCPFAFVLDKIFDGNMKRDSLVQFFYTISTIKNICLKFGVPIRHYLSMHQRAWSNYELNKLKNFYELQNQIADDPNVDTEFINSLYVSEKKPFFAPITFSDVRNNPYFKKYLSKVIKISLDTTKTKKRNDYVLKPF